MLSEGEHEVPFSFKLPEKYVLLNCFWRFDSIFICFNDKRNIPSTFVGPHGIIKYYIEVITKELGFEVDHRMELLEFIVDSPQKEGLTVSFL